MVAMGGITDRDVVAILVGLANTINNDRWATCVCDAHSKVLQLQRSSTVAEHGTANLIAPRRNIIVSAGDPSSIAHDIPPMAHTDVTPSLYVATVTPKEVRLVAFGLKKLAEWRTFINMRETIHKPSQLKLLTHSGHGSVSILQSDISCARRVPIQLTNQNQA